MDKNSSTLRKYLNERADLAGAILLANTAFKQKANTEVTTDIVILKKRRLRETAKKSGKDAALTHRFLTIQKTFPGSAANRVPVSRRCGPVEQAAAPNPAPTPAITAIFGRHKAFIWEESFRSRCHGSWKWIKTISDLVPTRMGTPQVPAPLLV